MLNVVAFLLCLAWRRLQALREIVSYSYRALYQLLGGGAIV